MSGTQHIALQGLYCVCVCVCVWQVQVSTSKGYSEVPFLAFLALHTKRKKYSQVGFTPCYSQSEVVYAYQVLSIQSFRSVNPRVGLTKYHFWWLLF